MRRILSRFLAFLYMTFNPGYVLRNKICNKKAETLLSAKLTKSI